MSYLMYLSYTGRKTYLSCPYKYWFRYVKKQEAMDDPRKALFGMAMGKVFEWFYNKKFWADSNPENKCLEAADLAIDDVCDEKRFDTSINHEFVAELRGDLRKLIPSIVKTIREHRLLNSGSRSEVDLTVVHTSKQHGLTLKIGGRSDFVHGPIPVWIVDGKGSVHREKYVDAEQLIWYAVQHYLKYHVAPDRLGFLHYRFPDDPIQWIVYDEKAMRSNLKKTFDTAILIKNEAFDAKPSGECHRCEFHMFCQDGTKYLASRRVANGGRVESSIFDLESVTCGTEET